MMMHFFHALNGVSSVVVSFLMKQMLFSSILFLILFLVIKMFRRLSPYWHLGLWTLVLLRLLLPPDFSHSYSVRNLLSRLPYYQQLANSIMVWFSISSVEKGFEQGVQAHSLDMLSIENYQSAQSSDSAGRKNVSWQAIIFSIWLLGVTIFLFVYLNRIRYVQKLLNKAHPINHATIKLLLSKWQRQFQIKRKIQLFSSEQFLSPFTMGLFRPKIFVPQNFLEPANLEHLKSIIAHELAHIKRCDDLWLKIQNLIQIFYFFHPVVWYVNRRINIARECICDRMVLARRKISSEAYGKSLMNVLKLNLFGAEGFLMLPGFGNQKNALNYRIKNIIGGTTMKHTQFITLLVSLFVLGLLILPMAGRVSQLAEEPLLAAESSVQQHDEEAVLKVKITFALPIRQGKISAPFGEWLDPYTKKKAFHNGVDIAAPFRTEILAAADGIVAVAMFEQGPGKHLSLQHENGYQTFYSHCDSLLAQQGQHVKSGDVIAYVGQTGRSTGPHLHFEIRKDGAPQNPHDYLDFSMLKLDK